MPCLPGVLTFVAECNVKFAQSFLSLSSMCRMWFPLTSFGQVRSLPSTTLLWLCNRYINKGSHPPWSS